MSDALVVSEPAHLAQLDRARQMLAECRTLPEVKRIRDIAEAAKFYAAAANLGRESQNYAAEIALLAARKAGEILSQLEKTPAGGDRRSDQAATLAACSEYRKALDQTDTSERTARYWQEVSRIPERTFNDYLQQSKTLKTEISRAGLSKAAQRAEKKRRANLFI